MTDFKPLMLTVASAAAQVNCHPETIRRAIRAGTLGCYKLGGCTRIAPEQLAEWLERSKCPARDPNTGAADGVQEPAPSFNERMRAIGAELRRDAKIRRQFGLKATR